MVATNGDVTVTDEISFDYETRPFGTETIIRVKLVEETLEYAWIEAELVDQNGVRCLTSSKVLQFNSLGDGHLEVNMGTSRASGKLQAYNGRALIKLIKGGKKNIVSVQSENLETAFIEIN